MGELVDLRQRRERREAEEHARALVFFECAATLARQSHPALLKLIEQSFGADYIEQRVRDTMPRGGPRRTPRTQAR